MLPTNIQPFQDAFTQIGIDLLPAGEWFINPETRSKEGIDPFRTYDSKWENHPKDNLAKHKLDDSLLLVLDIDQVPTVIEGQFITIPCLDITIPLSFYTQTSKVGSYHIYYSITPEQKEVLPNRLTKLYGNDLDVFTHGGIFEAHVFSPHAAVHPLPILPLPLQLEDIVVEYTEDHNIATGGFKEPTVLPNRSRAYLAQKFLMDSLKSNREMNLFFRTVFPYEYTEELSSLKKLTFDHFDLSYDLINKIATKLTTTAELSYNHTVLILYKILEGFGIDPHSSKSQTLLHKNMLPSLPQHEAIRPPEVGDEQPEFEDLCDVQKSDFAIFQTISRGKIYFIEIDKATLRPVPRNEDYLLERSAAEVLHPERDIINEKGIKVGWDTSMIRLIDTVNSNNKPSLDFNHDTNQHVVNLYTRSEYVINANPSPTIPTHNVLYKTVKSVCGEYSELVLAYYAELAFSYSSPVMVLWAATLDRKKGGTGKSMVTITIPSFILRHDATSVDSKTVIAGWGDVFVNKKLLSLEDIPKPSLRDWEIMYANIKQANTAAYKTLNMKGAAIRDRQVMISVSGSSNYRPPLSPSDRRFLCIEPAHMEGLTEPLSYEDQETLYELERLRGTSPIVQEFTNYLNYLYLSNYESLSLSSEQIKKYIYFEAPETKYRSKWVLSGSTNTKAIISTLNQPEELMALIKIEETDINRQPGALIDLLKFLLFIYEEDSQKIALPWKWFQELVPFVQSDRYEEMTYSKASLSKMLGIDFVNCGLKYINKWKHDLDSTLPRSWKTWPSDGYVCMIDDDTLETYQDIVKELIQEYQS